MLCRNLACQPSGMLLALMTIELCNAFQPCEDAPMSHLLPDALA